MQQNRTVQTTRRCNRRARPRWAMALTTVAAIGTAQASFAALRYVNANLTTGFNDGSTWADAFQGSGGLSTALAASGSGDIIWVAQGTYKPTAQFASGGDQDKTFSLGINVKLYGGFAGGESFLYQRNPLVRFTYLSGDINEGTSPGLDAGNVWHVVRIQSASIEDEITDTTHLDGFIVTMGYADGSSLDGYGGGLLVGFASPVIKNCTFINNKAVTIGGGGAHVHGVQMLFDLPHADAKFYSCRFLGNDSDGEAGGLCNIFDRTELYNCVFSGNHADGAGGALYSTDADVELVIINCSFTDNSANSGGGIYASSAFGSLVVRNSILWSNTPTNITTFGLTPTISDSNVGTSDPVFVDANGNDDILGNLDDNLRLDCSSPSRNAGSNSHLVVDTYDVDDDGVTTAEETPSADRERRIQQSTVDQGAYEMVTNVCAGNINTTALGSASVVNIDDLLTVIGQWGPCQRPTRNS